MDRAAIAAQVGRIYADAGVLLTFGTLSFPATFEDYEPPVTDTDRNVGNNTCTVVKAPRALFSTHPRQGQHFSDADGKLYRVQEILSTPPSDPVIKIVCAVSPA